MLRCHPTATRCGYRINAANRIYLQSDYRHQTAAISLAVTNPLNQLFFEQIGIRDGQYAFKCHLAKGHFGILVTAFFKDFPGVRNNFKRWVCMKHAAI